MLSDRRFTEDIPSLAAEAYELSSRLCGSCRDMHALWPYIRLARASTGIEDRQSVLDAQLNRLLAGGARNVLIAGAADTGLLALVARVGAHLGAHITVLDICDTPLAMCRRFAKNSALQIGTMREDLMNFEMKPQFDIVLVHGTLAFLPADHRTDVLSRIRRSIRPGGVLVLLFNSSPPIAANLLQQSRCGYANWVVDELERLNIPLPDARETLRARLHAHAQRREAREGAFADPGDVDMLLKHAGFVVIDRLQIDVKLAPPVQSFISKLLKRRFIAIAEPRSAFENR
jgi:SAM-dependent methyltransferase